MGVQMNYLRDYKIPKRLEPLSNEIYSYYYSYMEQALPVGSITNHKKKLMMRVCKCFTLNMGYFCHKNNNTIPVMYRKNYYAQDIIYNCNQIKRRVSWQYTMALFDALKHYGLASFTKGEVLSWEFDEYVGGVRPDEKTNSECTLCDELWQKVLEVNNHKDVKLNRDVLILRDEKKKPMQSDLSDSEYHLINNITQWNESWFHSNIEIDDKTYEVQGHKVFNNASFDQGGRTYLSGVEDMLEKKRRLKMKIDGKPVVEIDFKAQSPRIIAELEGDILDKDFDPYGIMIEGCNPEPLRKLAKVGFMCLIGSKSKAWAVKALNQHVRKDKKKDYTESEAESYINPYQKEGKLPEVIPCEDIIDALFARNTYAAEWFFSEKALYIQNIDSKIMDYCINYFIQNDKAIIPIHDSIIIHADEEADGLRVMRDAYERVLGSDYNCVLTVERDE